MAQRGDGADSAVMDVAARKLPNPVFVNALRVATVVSCFSSSVTVKIETMVLCTLQPQMRSRVRGDQGQRSTHRVTCEQTFRKIGKLRSRSFASDL